MAVASQRTSGRGSVARQALNQLLVTPDIEGPKIRLGILWFLCSTAVVFAGHWPVAIWWAGTAALAAVQTLRVWEPPGTKKSDPVRLIAAGLVAALVPLIAGWSAQFAGLALIVGALALPVVELARGRRPAASGAAAISALLPAIAAVAVVLVTQVNLLTGLFLILAVSFFDAGFFVMGSEASHRWEGLAGGVVGVLAVTFAVAAFRPPPFGTASAWIAGAVIAAACPIGQWTVTLFLPSPTTRAPALRRIDSYLLAAPLLLAFVWVLSG